MDLNGTKVFEKTYNKAGAIKERIALKENQKGKFIVRLWDPNRTISKQIIIE